MIGAKSIDIKNLPESANFVRLPERNRESLDQTVRFGITSIGQGAM
jgi:hypothetical protein